MNVIKKFSLSILITLFLSVSANADKIRIGTEGAYPPLPRISFQRVRIHHWRRSSLPSDASLLRDEAISTCFER